MEMLGSLWKFTDYTGTSYSFSHIVRGLLPLSLVRIHRTLIKQVISFEMKESSVNEELIPFVVNKNWSTIILISQKLKKASSRLRGGEAKAGCDLFWKLTGSAVGHS